MYVGKLQICNFKYCLKVNKKYGFYNIIYGEILLSII